MALSNERVEVSFCHHLFFIIWFVGSRVQGGTGILLGKYTEREYKKIKKKNTITFRRQNTRHMTKW